MKKRKTILLNRNKSVSMYTHSIADIRASRNLVQAKWVMIPIANTSSTYIAVDADTILTREFDRADIEFHMQLKNLERDEMNVLVETVLFDYYTTKFTVNTVEELYNAAYNVLAYHYIKELYAECDYDEEFHFIDVVDFAVRLYKGNREVSSLIVTEDVDDVPFDYCPIDTMIEKISQYLGIMGSKSYYSLPSICIYRDSDKLTWKQTSEPIALTRNVYGVFDGNPSSKSFTFLNTRKYDAALRMTNASLFITPITGCKLTKEFLPIAAAYQLPKYSFDNGSATADYTENNIVQDFYDHISMVMCVELKDSSSIISMIDHIHFIMQVFLEGAKVQSYICRKDLDRDFHDMRYESTLLAHVVIDLESLTYPSDDQLVIYTDPYEDNPPNIKEVTKLLILEEENNSIYHIDVD